MSKDSGRPIENYMRVPILGSFGAMKKVTLHQETEKT